MSIETTTIHRTEDGREFTDRAAAESWHCRLRFAREWVAEVHPEMKSEARREGRAVAYARAIEAHAMGAGLLLGIQDDEDDEA